MIGFGGNKPVDNDDAFDHVGEHCNKRSVAKCNGNNAAVFAAANGAIDTKHAWRAAKTWGVEAEALGFGGDEAGNRCELHGDRSNGGGCYPSTHGVSMTHPCGTVTAP